MSASLTTAAVHVQNLTTGATVTPASVTFNAATNTATFTFAGKLPDGNYAVTLLASAISDAGGIHLAADYSLNFFFLTGDINHDRAVNFNDLLTLAQNYGRSNATYSQGDLTYDGAVSFSDLLLLAQNYGHTLVATAAQAPAASFLSAMQVLGQTEDIIHPATRRHHKPASR